MIFKCKAILFDLDGVLVDSTPAVERVWREWAVEHGLDPEHVIVKAHGRRSIDTVRLLAPQLDAERENLKLECREIADKKGIMVLPGALELLPQSAMRTLGHCYLRDTGFGDCAIAICLPPFTPISGDR